MKLYMAIFCTQTKKLLQYRAAVISSIFTQFFFGLVRIEVMIAFYKNTPSTQVLSLPSAVLYIWITQMLLGFIAYRPNPEIVTMVKSGTIAYEMARPIRLSLAWFHIALGNRLVGALMRFIPMLGLVMLLPPPYFSYNSLNFGRVFIFMLVFVLAGIVASAFNNLFNIMTVYLMSADGLVRFIPILSFFFTGIILPLPLFPDSIKPFVYALPFAGFMDFPARVLSGDIVGVDIIFIILHQIIWTIILLVVSDFLLKRRLKSVTVQGG